MIILYKQKGETPLQALGRLRKEKTEYADAVLSYAGRLDPMAEGVMLVLVGEENKEREKYLGLDKTYVTEILFGVSTDTGDVLGKVKKVLKSKVGKLDIEKELQKTTGKQMQKYPVYSSKSFAGSFEDVREGQVLETSHEVEMRAVELLEIREIGVKDVLQKIQTDIAKVDGDFRQEEILKTWQENLCDISYRFQVAKIRLAVSSGFYVRQFAEDLGEKFAVPALAFFILREKVGEWEITDCIL